MTKVTFENYNFRFAEDKGQKKIFDAVRKKFVVLTPEEWVRQHCLAFLLAKGFSPALIAVERQIKVNGLQKRFDLVVFNRDSSPLLLVECKASTEKIDDQVWMQILSYNLPMKASYFWLTNGEQHFFYRLSDQTILSEIPSPNLL